MENVAVLATILDIVNGPPGLVIIVLPSDMKDTSGPWIVLDTVRLLVVMPLEAVIFCVFIPGSVMASEKRRSEPR